MESKINYMSNCKRKMIAENAAFFIFRLLSGLIVTVLFIILAFIILPLLAYSCIYIPLIIPSGNAKTALPAIR